MKIFAETERLILRELMPEDETGMFALDSDPEVHRYLGNKPVQNMEQVREVITFIRQQYVDNGIGRWAVVNKQSNAFMGWAGLKLMRDTVNGHTHFYDVGYRFIRQYWGQGYATEAAKASITYGFQVLEQDKLFAMADVDHTASCHVLEKAGMERLNIFEYYERPHFWFAVSRPQHSVSGMLS